MKLFRCRCSVAQLTRLKRPVWLRVVPLMRLCFCRKCKTRVFTLRDPQWWPHFVYTNYRRQSHRPEWQVTQPMQFNPPGHR